MNTTNERPAVGLTTVTYTAEASLSSEKSRAELQLPDPEREEALAAIRGNTVSMTNEKPSIKEQV